MGIVYSIDIKNKYKTCYFFIFVFLYIVLDMKIERVK